jgi:hypothetical protein
MLTADTITDEQILERVAEALARFERGADTANDREFVHIYKMAMLPHMLMPALNDEDHAEVVAVRVRLAEILNAAIGI